MNHQPSSFVILAPKNLATPDWPTENWRETLPPAAAAAGDFSANLASLVLTCGVYVLESFDECFLCTSRKQYMLNH